MSMALVRELEQAVVESWPAAECQPLDGWLLRASGGPTHRGNSVATLAAGTALGLEERLARAEAWYLERRQLAQFQVGPCAAPEQLDAELERRGYRREGEALVMTGAATSVAQRSVTASPVTASPVTASPVTASPVTASPASPLRTLVEAQPGAAWRDIASASSRFASSAEVLDGFLARLAGRSHCVTAWLGDVSPASQADAAAAMGLGIRHGRWLGVYAMHTRPQQRRRGAARALLHALARHALSEGVADLYLLVESGNVAAHALYAQCGFQDLYRYHYRIQGGEPR